MMVLTLLTKMIACSTILFGYYWLFLRNKRFHHYNRFFLLAATGLSITIPCIKIPIFFEADTATSQIVNKSIDIISVNRWEDEFVDTGRSGIFSSLLTLQNVLTMIYVLVTLALLYFLGRSVVYIRTLSKKYSYKYIHALKFYNTTEPGTPFSFFRSIFWNSRLDINTSEGQQIFRHELFHVKQGHTADIIFMELVSIIFWINPVFHLIKKEVKAIHEFLADQHAISDNNQHKYAELLILQSISTKKSSISNYFFQNHIKRRIAMITDFKPRKYGYLTRLLVLPLSIFLFCAVALYAKSPDNSSDKNPRKIPSVTTSQSLTVLIDAGHGGQDAGARTANGIQEKDLSLAIAKQINQYASSYNINAVMTRSEDVYPSLKERSGMAESVKADLIVSVHIGSAETPTIESGFNVFVTNKNLQTVDQSKLLGLNISNEIKSLYTVGPIKQRKEKGIWILDAVTCPAVLIECGYLTNEKDLAFISSVENQKKIALSILEGIAKYKSRVELPNVKDTLPPKAVNKANVKTKSDQNDSKEEMAKRKLAEARIEIQKEQEILLQKHQELQLNLQRLEIQNEQIQKEQNILIQKRQNLEQDRQKISNEQTVALQNEQNRLYQKQVELKMDQLTRAAVRNNEIEAEQRRSIQKQERNLEEQNLAQEKYMQMDREQQMLIEKHHEMEKVQRNIDLVETIQDSLSKNNDGPVFTKVEVEATYPGGAQAWQRYLMENLRYPAKAVQKNISGTVVVEFIVDKKGSLSDINVMSGPQELRPEAVRIIRESGKWTPARQNGQIVKAYRRQSIAFKLEK